MAANTLTCRSVMSFRSPLLNSTRGITIFFWLYIALLVVVYGTTINIAARMEEAAKAHGIACAISGDVAENLLGETQRLVPIGHEKVRGSTVEIPIYEYRVTEAGSADRALGRRDRVRRC